MSYFLRNIIVYSIIVFLGFLLYKAIKDMKKQSSLGIKTPQGFESHYLCKKNRVEKEKTG